MGPETVVEEEGELPEEVVEVFAAAVSSWMFAAVSAETAEEEEEAEEDEAEEEVLFADPLLLALSSALRVFLPASPSDVSPWADWKARTAVSVLLPKIPSAFPDR